MNNEFLGRRTRLCEIIKEQLQNNIIIRQLMTDFSISTTINNSLLGKFQFILLLCCFILLFLSLLSSYCPHVICPSFYDLLGQQYVAMGDQKFSFINIFTTLIAKFYMFGQKFDLVILLCSIFLDRRERKFMRQKIEFL